MMTLYIFSRILFIYFCVSFDYFSLEPSIEYETLRRRLFHNIMEFSNFVNSQIMQAKTELKESKLADSSLSNFMNMADEFKRFEKIFTYILFLPNLYSFTLLQFIC